MKRFKLNYEDINHILNYWVFWLIFVRFVLSIMCCSWWYLCIDALCIQYFYTVFLYSVSLISGATQNIVIKNYCIKSILFLSSEQTLLSVCMCVVHTEGLVRIWQRWPHHQLVAFHKQTIIPLSWRIQTFGARHKLTHHIEAIWLHIK